MGNPNSGQKSCAAQHKAPLLRQNPAMLKAVRTIPEYFSKLLNAWKTLDLPKNADQAQYNNVMLKASEQLKSVSDILTALDNIHLPKDANLYEYSKLQLIATYKYKYISDFIVTLKTLEPSKNADPDSVDTPCDAVKIEIRETGEPDNVDTPCNEVRIEIRENTTPDSIAAPNNEHRPLAKSREARQQPPSVSSRGFWSAPERKADEEKQEQEMKPTPQ